jgi:hypothetical protein
MHVTHAALAFGFSSQHLSIALMAVLTLYTHSNGLVSTATCRNCKSDSTGACFYFGSTRTALIFASISIFSAALFSMQKRLPPAP